MASDENLKKVAELEVELQLTNNEVSRLQSALSDVNDWKAKLIKESMLIKTTYLRMLCIPP
jgi:predicted  nucleic acid-binding Zn-ribbon protein